MNDCGLCFGCYVVIVVVAHSFSVPFEKEDSSRCSDGKPRRSSYWTLRVVGLEVWSAFESFNHEMSRQSLVRSFQMMQRLAAHTQKYATLSLVVVSPPGL